MRSQVRAKSVAFLGLMLALALILSYVEALIPFNIGIPGIKLGLANTACVFLLYYLNTKSAFTVGLLRVILAGLLFGNMFSILYSLAGFIFSFFAMLIVKKTRLLSMISVSATGGICHNIGQYIIAVLIVSNYRILYYLPVLILSGLITGVIIGIISYEIIIHMPKNLME